MTFQTLIYEYLKKKHEWCNISHCSQARRYRIYLFLEIVQEFLTIQIFFLSLWPLRHANFSIFFLLSLSCTDNKIFFLSAGVSFVKVIIFNNSYMKKESVSNRPVIKKPKHFEVEKVSFLISCRIYVFWCSVNRSEKCSLQFRIEVEQ